MKCYMIQHAEEYAEHVQKTWLRVKSASCSGVTEDVPLPLSLDRCIPNGRITARSHGKWDVALTRVEHLPVRDRAMIGCYMGRCMSRRQFAPATTGERSFQSDAVSHGGILTEAPGAQVFALCSRRTLRCCRKVEFRVFMGRAPLTGDHSPREMLSQDASGRSSATARWQCHYDAHAQGWCCVSTHQPSAPSEHLMRGCSFIVPDPSACASELQNATRKHPAAWVVSLLTWVRISRQACLHVRHSSLES